MTRLCLLAVVMLALGCAPTPDSEGNNATRTPAAPSAPRAQVIGRGPPAVEGIPSVAILQVDDGAVIPFVPDTVVMDQRELQFVPSFLAIRAGDAVTFTSGEDVPHTVRVANVTTREPLFDRATPIGEPYTHTFTVPGEYSIACDIHPMMLASIFVAAGAYVTWADPDGTFSFPNVAVGSYTLRIWSADTLRQVHRVEIDGSVGQVLEPMT